MVTDSNYQSEEQLPVQTVDRRFRSGNRNRIFVGFITPLHNVSLCLPTIFVVFFTISGIEILASNKAATRLSMAPIPTQLLYKPSLLICIGHPSGPWSVSVNNLPAPIRKLYKKQEESTVA